MLQHPQFNPVALQIGPLAVHWYGLMYLLAFALVWLLGRRRIRQGKIALTQRQLEDLLFYGVLGVIVGGRGDHYFLHPETRNDPAHLAFIKAFRDKTGAYPIYPTYHMAQSLTALKQGYEQAIAANGGNWPTVEQVAEAIRGLNFKAFGRPIQMRADGQGLEAQLLGTTRKVADYPFPVMDQMMIVPAELVTPPPGVRTHDWIGKLTPDILKADSIKTYNYQP